MSDPPPHPIAITPSDFSEALKTLTDSLPGLYLPTAPPRVLPLSPTPTTLTTTLPPTGLGLPATLTHLLHTLPPTLPRSATSPHYYGFVTGGATPAALLADLLVSTLDQNVQVHLPAESSATAIEARALALLLDLFRLTPATWPARAFTTGATGANILALAAAREHLLPGAAETGLQGRDRIQILAAMPHASIAKAASITGLGRSSLVDLSRPSAPWALDLPRLATALQTPNTKSIIVVSYGEVNTGRFDPSLPQIWALASAAGAWVHVDAAFGIFARAVSPTGAFADVAALAAPLDACAHSVAGDAHKLLNVPYDCGFFFARDAGALTAAFTNGAAPYLAAGGGAGAGAGDADGERVESPLNTHLENSQRFRALPVYATLTAYGAAGYGELVGRLVAHARGIAGIVAGIPELELLPEGAGVAEVFVVVLFRARDEAVNRGLRERINAAGGMYVSPAMWGGRSAVRCAVGNWRVAASEGGEGGWGGVRGVLEGAVKRAEAGA
ncbi:pyridoxal phosphate-dependent transferase [Geopyxis carbonaria]|nr:pyridoxal phosphate-dependent transferase [Geopyxis carbonaria]